MDFQKLTYIDNGVPSLSIGGFTNGVRVVDMAKGYSTLANGGVYNDQTCIRKIDHEHNGELTKNLKAHSQVVYQQDSAYMLTDVLKGTLNESYGTGYGLALESGMPAAGKTGTTNSSKDTWFCGYTRYYTTAVWVGYDTPRSMPGIYGKTYAGKIWKQVMDQIHEGKELLDWEQPATVEMTTDSKSGITDLFSATLHERAEQSLHDKEQRKLEEDLEAAVTAFEDKTIETVEDTYWVKEQYQSIISKLNLMDGSDKRTELLERITKRNEEFAPIISGPCRSNVFSRAVIYSSSIRPLRTLASSMQVSRKCCNFSSVVKLVTFLFRFSQSCCRTRFRAMRSPTVISITSVRLLHLHRP